MGKIASGPTERRVVVHRRRAHLEGSTGVRDD
jgi:hypothetical protein